MPYRLATALAVDDSGRLPAEVDLIALVSVGSTRTGLSRGAEATIKKTSDLLRRYDSKPEIVYGSFAGNAKGLTLEEDLKAKAFGDKGHYAGKVWTTISECLAFKRAFPGAKSVVFVTEATHSRRAQVVWDCLWPEAKIYIVSVPLEESVDSESCMSTYSNPWKAIVLQLGPWPLYKVLAMCGPKWLMLLAKIHQPTAHT